MVCFRWSSAVVLAGLLLVSMAPASGAPTSTGPATTKGATVPQEVVNLDNVTLTLMVPESLKTEHPMTVRVKIWNGSNAPIRYVRSRFQGVWLSVTRGGYLGTVSKPAQWNNRCEVMPVTEWRKPVFTSQFA